MYRTRPIWYIAHVKNGIIIKINSKSEEGIMQMIKIIVDSGCDISDEMLSDDGAKVEMVPLSLQIEDKSFIDDEHLDITEYLTEMAGSKATPKTAAPSPGSFLSKFLGEENIFAVTLSSKLSGSYNSAMTAKQMYVEDIGNKFIHVFDSLSASVAEMLIVNKIKEFAKNNVSNVEIVDAINKFIFNLRTYFILEKFDNLVKTGRINPAVAKIASLLSIKPICMSTREGVIAMADKAKGFKKAIEKMIELIINERVDFENRILAISHVKCLDKALYFKEEIMKKINFKEIIIVEARGVIATYADNLGIVIAF